MSKKTNAAIDTIEIATEPSIDEQLAPVTPEQEAADDAEIEEQIAKRATVVKPKYKARYRDAARASGNRSKAAKRSCWDWFAQAMARETLNKQNKLDVGKLVAILQANGEPDPLERWPNRSKGWEGRLRMTGGLWLRTVVAEEQVLRIPEADGTVEELVPPEEWVKQILRL